MCMTCGCGEPMNRHGEDANITYDQLQAAANAAGIDAPIASSHAPTQYSIVLPNRRAMSKRVSMATKFGSPDITVGQGRCGMRGF